MPVARLPWGQHEVRPEIAGGGAHAHGCQRIMVDQRPDGAELPCRQVAQRAAAVPEAQHFETRLRHRLVIAQGHGLDAAAIPCASMMFKNAHASNRPIGFFPGHAIYAGSAAKTNSSQRLGSNFRRFLKQFCQKSRP